MYFAGLFIFSFSSFYAIICGQTIPVRCLNMFQNWSADILENHDFEETLNQTPLNTLSFVCEILTRQLKFWKISDNVNF